jgi:glucosamine--fructose-6-phosphate aminotransferase (isomerizing)
LYALQFGRSRKLNLAQGQEIVRALLHIPEQMKKVLEQSLKIQEVAFAYREVKNMLFLGRGIQFPVALEGALKLKEISYIHSEGLPGGEMKHGPIALLSPEFPVFGIMTQNHLYEKMRSNIEEVRARHAPVILLATEGDDEAQRLAEHVIYIPKTVGLVEPFLTTIVLQLFAYHMAVILGRDVDRPRNLAKSVTVE